MKRTLLPFFAIILSFLPALSYADCDEAAVTAAHLAYDQAVKDYDAGRGSKDAVLTTLAHFQDEMECSGVITLPEYCVSHEPTLAQLLKVRKDEAAAGQPVDVAGVEKQLAELEIRCARRGPR